MVKQQESGLSTLRKELQERGLEADHLDNLVCDCKEQEALDINRLGTKSQLEYLLEFFNNDVDKVIELFDGLDECE